MKNSDSDSLTAAARSLKNQACVWRARLEKALLSVENQRRRALNVHPFDPEVAVYLPEGPKANLLLLNLKVWSERYSVTPEFILEFLTRWYRNSRHWTDNLNGQREVSLGLPASLVAGMKSRNLLEEAVHRAFPAGENRHASNFSKLLNVHAFDPLEFAQQYNAEMMTLRREHSVPSQRRYRT